MPDLLHALHPRDLGHLRIVAELWGLELTEREPNAARQELAAALLEARLVEETLAILPEGARSALRDLLDSGGRMPWAVFSRRYGEIEPAGPGRRDRERVHRQVTNPAGVLFYRALVERAFFDTPEGPQEFAFLPDDLQPLLEPSFRSGPAAVRETLGRPALPAERAHVLPRFDRLLDDATTLLAALRTGRQPPETPVPVPVVTDLLTAAGVLVDGKAGSEAARAFLEAERGEALAALRVRWQESSLFNELRQLPDLVCEGEWSNEPRRARRFLLEAIARLPSGQWWSLASFLHAVQKSHPDFQRPAGDYDSWFLRRRSDGAYLRGFAAWDQVDGALLHYTITGPLFWLGFVELASPAPDQAVSAFRPAAPLEGGPEDGRISVGSNGALRVPRRVPRAVRYQVARFCDWEAQKEDEYRYRVSPRSLTAAARQGLKTAAFLPLLARHAAAELPPAFVRAVKRWESHGTEARVEDRTLLIVRSPEILEELSRSKASRFLGERLGPTCVAVKPGAQARVLGMLAELGLLAEDRTGPADEE